MNKKVKRLFFAMLSVLGAGTLIACNNQIRSTGPSIVKNSNSNSEKETSSEKENTSNNHTTSQNTSENDNSNHNTGSDSNNNSTSSELTQEEIDRQIRQQLMSYEDEIETKLKNTLNTKFKEDVVDKIDIKTFDIETNQTEGTTLVANGYVNFAGDRVTYTTNLGMPIGTNDFMKLTPYSYINASFARDLADNYNIDQLKPVYDYITGANLSFNYATLNNQKWDLDCFTATQIEQYFEQKYEHDAKEFFKIRLNTEYITTVDLKYMTAEKNSSYGYLLRMSGTTENMYLPGKAIKFETWYKINEETLAKLQDIVNLEIDQTKDMAQNYNVSQLNRIKDIIENDATLFAYSADKTPYKIANVMNNTL